MHAGGIAPEHLAFETLPIAVLVLRDSRIAYVNPAWVDLVGMPREVAVGKHGMEMIAQGIDPVDRAWLAQHRAESEARGDPPPVNLWIHVISPSRGYSPLMQLQSWPGAQAGDQVFAFLDAQNEAQSRNLTHELVKGAASLLRHRDEGTVIEAALDVLFSQGLTCSILFPEGERIQPGPARQAPELVAAMAPHRAPDGRRPSFPKSLFPHLAQIDQTRRARFHQDISPHYEGVLPPEVFRAFRQTLRKQKGLDAPLFVDEALYAYLCVQSSCLTPASAAAIELFATHVGAAIENVRRHQEARARLGEVQRLQGQVVARERLSVLGEAAAVMAHEMQNPLGVILNGVALLRARPSDNGASVLKMMEEEARSLDRLARDLLSWAKPFNANFTELAVSDLLHDAVQQVSAGEAAPIIQVRPCDNRLRLWGDGYLLKLALSNLLRNALQASPPGERVEVWAEKPNGAEAIKLIVEDRGNGVPPELRERIFEPFFTSRAQGSGLGLALVARVIKAHAGEVRVLDGSPAGARFEVALPLPAHL